MRKNQDIKHLYRYIESLFTRTKQKKFTLTVSYRNIRDNNINHIFRLCFALDAFISYTIRALAKKCNSIKHA